MGKVAELLEQVDTEKARAAKLEADLAQERAKNAQREFSAWLSSDHMRTKVSPAMKADLLNIMEFAAATESYEFSAPDPENEKKIFKIKQAPLEVIKEFCERHLPDIITFGETATKKKAAGDKTNMADAQEIAAKASEFQKAESEKGRAITITEAVNHVTNK